MLKGDLVAFVNKPDELIGTMKGKCVIDGQVCIVVSGFEMGNMQCFAEELLVKFREG